MEVDEEAPAAAKPERMDTEFGKKNVVKIPIYTEFDKMKEIAKSIGLKYSNKNEKQLKDELFKIYKYKNRFGMKEDKNLVVNIKNLVRLQNIAKQNRIRITSSEKDTSNKYLTENQLLKELKKNKIVYN